MEQEEFKQLYNDTEENLSLKFWMIPKDRAMIFIGAATIFLAFAFGGSWLAVKTAVENSAANKAITKIIKIENDATESLEKLNGVLEAKDIENLSNILNSVKVRKNGVISIKFPNNKGRFQIESGGKVLWYNAPYDGGNQYEQIHSEFIK